MGKLFGTDGVRGVANQPPMTCDTIQKMGIAVAAVLGKKGRRRARVVIGKDTRQSGYMFESAFASGVVAAGAKAWITGPLPTPAIAFIASSMRCDAGVVISASHNPYRDNGVKIFAGDGYKLPDSTEAEIEEFIVTDRWKEALAAPTEIGTSRRADDAVGRYVVHCKATFPNELSLNGLKIVVDGANGAGYRAGPYVFDELGAEVQSIFVHPDGRNINEGCGALHPETMANEVKEVGADIGIALDGDGDRLVLCDEKGRILDGDHVLAMCAREMIASGQLHKRTVVATVMSNIGLETAVRGAGGTLVRTKVGDRYVVEKMRQEGFNLGGEQSGHLVFSDYSTTGDGIVAALRVLELMIRTQKPLSELARCMTKAPQLLKNVPVAQKKPLASMPSVQAAIAAAGTALGSEGRVLVRYSGTEQLARVMAEGPDESVLAEHVDTIAAALKKGCAE